jgi:hypothetical protein
MAFAAAKKQYYDNYIQYKLTGQPSYKTAYEGALQSMQNTIAALQTQVDSFSIPQVDSVPSFAQVQQNKHEAELRSVQTPVSRPSLPPMNAQYITLGVLGSVALILTVL